MSAIFEFVLSQNVTFRRVSAVVLLTVSLCEPSWAQEVAQDSPHGKHLGLYSSVGIASYREDLIVPLGFHGPAFSLGGVYTQQDENDLFQIRLRIGLGHFENRFSHEAWVMMQDIRLSWMRSLRARPKYGNFWGGASLPFQMNNFFFESWDDAHLYWLTAYSLAGALLWEKRMSPKNDVSIRVEIPFFGWVSRPPTYRYEKQEPLTHLTYHFTEPNKALHFETIDTYRNIFVQMLLRRQVRQSLLDVGLEFQYYYCREPEKILGFTSFIVLAYQWRIGR